MPRRAVRPKTAAEKQFCALGPVAEAFITGAAAAGATRLPAELAELSTLRAAHGEQEFLAALDRAVAFSRWRAADVRSILAAGAGIPLPQAAGDPLAVGLPAVLAIYREFGPPGDPGVVFFLGPGLLEVSGYAAGPPGHSVMIWIQVRDVRAEHAHLAAAGVPIIRGPATEPWGLTEMWIQDPDSIQIVLVEVPADHPLRRDPRSASPPR
jgi:hypothetical protein